MDLLKNSRRNPRSLSEKNYPLNLKHKDLLKTHDFLPKEDNKEVNVSILEEEKEKPKSKNRLNQVREPEIEQEHENVNYRNFLLNLAKELYTNSDVRSFFSVNKDLLKKMDIHNFNFRLQEYKFIIKPKRTLSNPLCYISEGLVRSLEKPPLKLKKGRLNNNNTKIRKMLYKGMSPGQFREGKSQILPSIFNLDVSKIANENLELSFDAKGGEEGFFLS